MLTLPLSLPLSMCPPQQSSRSLLVGEALVSVQQLQRAGGGDVSLLRADGGDTVQVRRAV